MIKIDSVDTHNNRPDKTHFRCTNCTLIYPKQQLRNVWFCYKIGGFSGHGVTLCQNCLFELQLALNDIFQTNPFTDGTDADAKTKFMEAMTPDITPEIIDLVKDGQYISAMKLYRANGGHCEIDLNNEDTYFIPWEDDNDISCARPQAKITLKQAKHKIDRLRYYMLQNGLVD